MLIERIADQLGYAGAMERASDRFFPYVDHIGPATMLLSDDSVMGTMRMPGAPFSLVMNGERNGCKRRLVAFLNAVADENVEVHIHLVKHDATLPPVSHGDAAAPYAQHLLDDYHASIQEDLAVVDWFLTIRVKPRKAPFASVTDKARDALARIGIGRASRAADPLLEVQLEDAMRLALGVLKPFGPVRLGERIERDPVTGEEAAAFSEIAEFLYLLRTTQFSPQPLADVCGFLGAGIAAVDVTAVARKRMLRIDHAAGGGAASQTWAAVVGMLTYPRRLDPSRMDGLLALPGRFVMTVAIRFQSRAEVQDSLDLLQRRLVAGNSRAVSDTEALNDAIDAVAGGRAESGISRWSLVLHGATPAEVDRLVSAARNVVANAGAKVGPEGKGMLNAFLAQLPGAPLSTWIRPAQCSTKQVAVLATLAGYPRGAAKARWDHHLFRLVSPAGTAYDHDLFVGDVGHNFLGGPNGGGKCLGEGTPVMMFDGSVKPVEQVAVGDLLMGPDSRPRRVVSLARGREELFRIKPTKGDPYVVNRSHILSLKTCSGSASSTGIPAGTVVNLTVDDFLARSKSFRRCTMGWRAAVDFAPCSDPLPLPPYLLGVWLGDGNSWHPEVTTGDAEVPDYMHAYAAQLGMVLQVRANSANSESCLFTHGPENRGDAGARVKQNPVKEGLRALDPPRNKHIPQSYRTATRQERLELLAGILDSDGHHHHGGYDLTLKSERLMDDVIFVARSLGFAAYKSSCRKVCTNNGVAGAYWRCSIFGPVDDIPCKIERKCAPPRRQVEDPLITAVTAEGIGEGDYYGFTLAGPDRLFLLGDFTVTHNTVWMGMNIAALDGPVSRKGGTQIVLDVDESNHNTIVALGGRYSTLQVGRSGIAPLRGLPDTPRVRAILRDLVAGLVQTDGAPAPNKGERDGIRQGIDFVMGEMEPHERSFTTVRSFMGFEEHGAGERLEPWCADGELGWVFDGDEHLVDFNTRLVGVDLTAVMNDARIMPPIALMLLWMASDVMDGRRVVIWCEEAPAYMPTPAFAKPFKGIALRARKRNASFNAIAQQPSDMLENEAGKALIKQARQMIFFKNEKAEEADYRRGLGCTLAEFHAVREGMLALPYHSVLIKRQDGQSGLCRFDLSTLPQHLNVLAGEPKRVVLLRGCLDRHGGDIPKALAEFNRRIHETAA